MDPDQHSTSLEFFVETDTKYVRATRHLRFSKHGLDWLLTFMRPRNKLFNLSFAGLFIRPGAVFNASGVVTLVNLVDEAKSLISVFSHTFTAESYKCILSSNLISADDLVKNGFVVDKKALLKLDVTISAGSGSASAGPGSASAASSDFSLTVDSSSNHTHIVACIFKILGTLPSSRCSDEFLGEVFTQKPPFAKEYCMFLAKTLSDKPRITRVTQCFGSLVKTLKSTRWQDFHCISDEAFGLYDNLVKGDPQVFGLMQDDFQKISTINSLLQLELQISQKKIELQTLEAAAEELEKKSETFEPGNVIW